MPGTARWWSRPAEDAKPIRADGCAIKLKAVPWPRLCNLDLEAAIRIFPGHQLQQHPYKIARNVGTVMTGITLSAEQVRRAPAEVRRWIEHEVATSLGFQVQATDSQRQIPQLAGCRHDELAAMLSLIQGVFPAVNVFFELGRKGMSFAQDRLEAYRLSDIQHHTRLQSPEQVISCLNLINESLHRVRGSTGASFYGADGDYCFVATETQQNIRRLWYELLGRGESATAPAEAASGDGPALQESVPANDRPTASDSPGKQSLQV